uniref:SET domain-containing protein n=1 Tax=Steinernema glaseri TaxID=37863 RepID=A0A1I7ZN35_9BILA
MSNELDLQQFNLDEEFILESVFSEDAMQKLRKCSLFPGCTPSVDNVGRAKMKNCRCSEGQQTVGCCGGAPYNLASTPMTLVDDFAKEKRTRGLQECSAVCDCTVDSCHDRVLQRGRQHRLLIGMTEYKGFGVFAVDFIPRGALVTEHVGDVQKSGEAGADMRYSWTMSDSTERDSQERLVLDSIRCGNEARFLNHACDPNCATFPFSVEFDSPAYRRIGIFARRDIQPGDEVTIDYKTVTEEEDDYKKRKSKKSPEKKKLQTEFKEMLCRCKPDCKHMLIYGVPKSS